MKRPEQVGSFSANEPVERVTRQRFLERLVLRNHHKENHPGSKKIDFFPAVVATKMDLGSLVAFSTKLPSAYFCLRDISEVRDFKVKLIVEENVFRL